MPPCQTCCLSTATTACSGCYLTYYCGSACQAAGWPAHSPLCAPANARKLLRARGSTPLHFCAERGATIKSLKLMLRLGINPEVRDRDGHTALMTAALRGRVDSLRVLLDGGADVNACSVAAHNVRDVVFSALTFAGVHAGSSAAQAPAQALACMRLLLARGARCAAEDAVIAAQFGVPEIVALVAAHA